VDALEAKAISDEKAEKKEAENAGEAETEGEGDDAPPALPASVESGDDGTEEAEAEAESDTDADADVEEAPKRRFHLPPVEPVETEEPPAEDADSAPDAESLTIDHESSEDTD